MRRQTKMVKGAMKEKRGGMGCNGGRDGI